MDAAPDFFFTESPIDLGSRSSTDAIKAAIGELSAPPVLIVIDTQARATPGREENSNTEMGVVMNNCKELADEFGTFVLLVHHSGKSGPGARGASAQLAAVDASIQVDGDGRSFRVEKVKEAAGGQVRHFEVVEAAGSVYVRQADGIASAAQASLDRERDILDFVDSNPGTSKSKVADAIGGRRSVVLDEIDALIERGRLENRGTDARPKLHVLAEAS